MGEAYIDLEAMQSLVTTMGTAATDLRGVKADLAGILGGVSLDTSPPQPLETAASWVESQVPGLRRRLAMAQAIAASTPNFKAGNAVPIDESKLSTLSPTEAMKIGTEAANRINDGGEDGPDPELAKWLSEYANDPYFASALAKGSTPDEIATYLRDAGYKMGSTRSDGMYNSEEDFQSMLVDYKATVAGLSTALSTATRNESPDLALPSGYADDFADTITDDENINGEAAILGNLLKDGAWGTDFLDTVSTKVYDYERGDLAESGRRWGDRTPDSSWYAYDANGDYLDVHDPLAGVLGALGHNAEASQNFFTQGGDETVEMHDQDLVVNSRLKYLTQDRTWAGSKNSDEGDGLGQALRAATTVFRNRLPSGETSATLASQTIALVGWKTHDDDGWHMYDDMRDDVADIIADYTPDMYREYSENSGAPDDIAAGWFNSNNPADLPNGPYGMVFNRDDMKEVLKTLGENPENIDKISVAALAFNRVKVNYALGQIDDPELKWKILKGDDVPEYVNPSLVGPTVLGGILQDAYDGLDDKEKRDKAKAEAISKWLDIAGSLPVLKIPGEGLKVVYANWGVDKLKSAALGQLAKGPSGTAESLYSSRDTSTQEALQHDTMNLLLQNGFYDESVMKAGSAEMGGKGAAAPPPGALNRDSDGNVTGFNFASDDYANWVQGTSGGGNPPWWGLAPGMDLPGRVRRRVCLDVPQHRMRRVHRSSRLALAAACVVLVGVSGCGGDDPPASLQISGDCALGDADLPLTDLVPRSLVKKLVGTGDFKTTPGLVVKDQSLPAAYDGRCDLKDDDGNLLELVIFNRKDPSYAEAQKLMSEGDATDGFVKIDETTFAFPEGKNGARITTILPDRIVRLIVVRPEKGTDAMKEAGPAMAEVVKRVQGLS